jgi:DNA-binding NtrC family response regulator
MNIRVLIVEDEQLIRWSLRQKFEERGYEVIEAEDGAAADAALDEHNFDLVMLDLKLPDTTGIDVLRKVIEKLPDAAIIMMTAYSTVDTAVEAIKLGAFSYVSKPFQMENLLSTVDQALAQTSIARETAAHRSALRHEHGFDLLIGNHPEMQTLYDMIGRVAGAGGSTVFIRGETGTGKDLVARVIHHCSPRAAQPFYQRHLHRALGKPAGKRAFWP